MTEKNVAEKKTPEKKIPEKRRIMLIDDDAALLQSLTLALKKHGCDVFPHADPMEALKALRACGKAVPDLVITDLQLPKLDGAALMRTMRAIGLKKVPVLVITGYGSSETRRELEQLGASAILDKPFTPEDLVRRVDAILNEGDDE